MGPELRRYRRWRDHPEAVKSGKRSRNFVLSQISHPDLNKFPPAGDLPRRPTCRVSATIATKRRDQDYDDTGDGGSSRRLKNAPTPVVISLNRKYLAHAALNSPPLVICSGDSCVESLRPSRPNDGARIRTQRKLAAGGENARKELLIAPYRKYRNPDIEK